MTVEEFVKIALEKHFNDKSEEFMKHQDKFIERLKDIYVKESSELTEDNMDSILFDKYKIV